MGMDVFMDKGVSDVTAAIAECWSRTAEVGVAMLVGGR